MMQQFHILLDILVQLKINLEGQVIFCEDIQISNIFQIRFYNYYQFQNMADVSLDDLIKQDKDKHKAQRANKTFKKKIIHKQRNQNDSKQNTNQPHHKANKPQFKNKQRFEGKKFQHAEKTERPQKIKQHKPKEEVKGQETQQKEKLFRTLKVMGLSPEFTNQDLYKLFATEGAMQKCLIEQDNFGRSLNTAIVKYHNHQHAKSAIQNLNRHKIMNCVLTVQPYKNVKK